MLSKDQFSRIKEAIPIFKRLSPELQRDFQATAFPAHLPVGREVFAQGDACQSIALLASGVVRVYTIGGTGREITLYRFGPGESCILTANCILSEHSFPAIATVEQEAEAIMIPANSFRDWVRRYDLWRDFLFDLLSQRLSSLMTVVDEVAFQRMDRRIASLLLDRSQIQNPISITHQEIANELGSSREVVSRLLEDFAAREMVRLSRGEVEILDRQRINDQLTL